jgi:hypothetical protein
MTGTIHTVRSNQESINNAGGWAASAGGSLAAVTPDQNDGTWMSGINNGTVTLGFGSYTLQPNERCRACSFHARLSSPFGATTATWALGNFTAGQWSPNESYQVGAIGWFDGIARTAYADGTEWTQDHLDNIQAKMSSTTVGGTTVLVVEERVDIEVVTQPVVAITAPVGVNPGATRQPVVKWTSTMLDGYSQKKYWIRVYNLAQNPTPIWSSGYSRAFATPSPHTWPSRTGGPHGRCARWSSCPGVRSRNRSGISLTSRSPRSSRSRTWSR